MRPNGRNLYEYSPNGVLMVLNSLEASSNGNCKNAFSKSILEKIEEPDNFMKMSSGSSVVQARCLRWGLTVTL